MTHSKCLSRIIKFYETQDLGEFDYHTLGPNWRTILNFWTYVEKLDDLQQESITRKYNSIYRNNGRAIVDGYQAACNVVGERLIENLWCGFGEGFNLFNTVTLRATYELIGMDVLLDSGKKLYFVPMFDLSKPEIIVRTLQEILDDLQPGCTLTIPGVIDVPVPIRLPTGISIRNDGLNNTIISRL